MLKNVMNLLILIVKKITYSSSSSKMIDYCNKNSCLDAQTWTGMGTKYVDNCLKNNGLIIGILMTFVPL